MSTAQAHTPAATGLTAVFLPRLPPDTPLADALSQASQAQAIHQGLRLCCNGRQFALMPRPAKGWALWGTA